MMLGVITGMNFEYFLIHVTGSLTAVMALHRIRQRMDITHIGFRVAVAMGLATGVIWLMGDHTTIDLEHVVIRGGWAMGSGVLSAVLVLILLPYLESFFSRTTNIKLLELADFNRPLLRRLMIDAPGTYHHSLIMASLAEQAAEAIGANSLLARVGSYYHDIGKVVKPEYFIENQQTMGNPHDPLAPTMSCLVVIAHVKEGVALARANGIDRVIIDCIEQHHGTSVIHYFYLKALEQNAELKPEDFRYPGPKPRSKETAILMLADAVEAASRTLDDPSPSRLQDMVEKIINNKFTDGQFTECSITLHDLSNIADSMVATLNSIFHARIEYKDIPEKPVEPKEPAQRKETPHA